MLCSNSPPQPEYVSRADIWVEFDIIPRTLPQVAGTGKEVMYLIWLMQVKLHWFEWKLNPT